MPLALDRLRQSALPRHVDRVLGTPLLWLLGALRAKRGVPREISRVGIMVFETLGDTLLAGTIIASLRASFPSIEIVVFASRGNAGILALMDGIDRVVDVPLLRPVAALRSVRSVPVDVMIDVGQWPRWYALLCVLSRSKFTIGFDAEAQGRHYAFDAKIAHRRDRHEVENFQALLEPLRPNAVVPPDRSLKPVGDPRADLGLVAPYVVVHPWPGGFNSAAREWPLERWCELARRLRSAGCAVVISGSPSERGRAVDLAQRCGGEAAARSIAGECDLAGLAAVLAHAAAAVCVNTGIMHLAALVGTPLVALHGPTSRRRWGPLGANAVALAPPDDAQCEFLHLGFEYPARSVECMDRITVDEVFAALEPLLQGKHERTARASR